MNNDDFFEHVFPDWESAFYGGKDVYPNKISTSDLVDLIVALIPEEFFMPELEPIRDQCSMGAAFEVVYQGRLKAGLEEGWNTITLEKEHVDLSKCSAAT